MRDVLVVAWNQKNKQNYFVLICKCFFCKKFFGLVCFLVLIKSWLREIYNKTSQNKRNITFGAFSLFVFIMKVWHKKL